MEFLDTMMPEIFDTLRSCDIQNSKREPFKIVWIKLLEFFIQSLSADEDRLSAPAAEARQRVCKEDQSISADGNFPAFPMTEQRTPPEAE